MLFALLLLSATATTPTSLPGVGTITLEDLWNRSGVVVLGRVEKVERIPREVPSGRPKNSDDKWLYEPSVPFAVVDVQRVFRGPKDLKSVLVFAQSTWMCDNTRAEPGETALFFLDRSSISEREGEVFHAVVRDQEVQKISWWGRGRMPVRGAEGRELLDFSFEVRMPETIAVVDGPDPIEQSYIRSVALTEITATLEGLASLESRPLLAATALSAGSPDQSWDLLVAEDGWCRLTIHLPPRGDELFPDPKNDRHRFFRVAEDRIGKLTEVLEREWTADLPRFVGSATPNSWQRELRRYRRVADSAGGITQVEDSVKLAQLDEARLPAPETRGHTVSVLRIWRELRGTFDIPDCVDLRQDDARWIE